MIKQRKPLEILIVEDRPEQQEDIKELFHTRGDLIKADYGATLEEAYVLLEKKAYDGIMTDAFFPEKEGSHEDLNGDKIVNYAMENKIPWVVVTSTDRHGVKTQPITSLVRRYGHEIIHSPNDNMDADSDTKDWASGVVDLIYFIDGIEEGWLKFKEGKVRDIDGGTIGRPEFKECGQKYAQICEKYEIKLI